MKQQIQILTQFKQKSEEWHQQRLGKITGSCIHKLLGTPAAAEKYYCDKANEIIIQDRCDRDKIEKLPIHMERGEIWEDIARKTYKIEKDFNNENVNVEEVGLVQLSDYVVCSPDGLVNDDGLIEIKVHDSNLFLWHVVDIEKRGIDAIPKNYYQQIQFNLYVLGRKWCDYVLYNPQHDAMERLRIFIRRVEIDYDLHKRISQIIEEAPQKINEYIERYNNIMKI